MKVIGSVIFNRNVTEFSKFTDEFSKARAALGNGRLCDIFFHELSKGNIVIELHLDPSNPRDQDVIFCGIHPNAQALNQSVNGALAQFQDKTVFVKSHYLRDSGRGLAIVVADVEPSGSGVVLDQTENKQTDGRHQAGARKSNRRAKSPSVA